MSYVVLEWNQASGRPKLATDELCDNLDEARDVAAAMRRYTADVGRRERYTVHEIDLDEAAS